MNNRKPNRNKATHFGNCQCCGSKQKLPGGVLSSHGYTVDWGFFNGVCQGAGYLPYEKSFDLIEKFIASATAHLATLEANYAKLMQPATSPVAWIHEYRAGKYRVKGGYFWLKVEVCEETTTTESGYQLKNYFYVESDKKKAVQEYGVKSILELATQLNGRRAHSLLPIIAKTKEYIAWQQKRIANWKPAELTPIE